MFEKGFSTKGSDRGLGLLNVKEIVNKNYINVSLNTCIESGLFKQELIIKFRDIFKENSSTYESIYNNAL